MTKELKPQIGDRIKVELNTGEIFEGTFDINPLADECVLNQYNFPFSYKKILEIL